MAGGSTGKYSKQCQGKFMNKTVIIAEAGVNHNGDPAIARQLVDVAVEAGADIVKFQTFRAEKLVSMDAQKADYQLKTTKNGDKRQFYMLKKLEIDTETHEMLFDYCDKKKIEFLSTAFDNESITFLNRLGLKRFKISSGEITNLPYLKKVGFLGKPVILSTGMSDLGEVEDALDILLESGLRRDQITLLHCNTEYPTPFEDVNLKAMQTMALAFDVAVGYSDHTPGIEVPIAAVAMGAGIIEKHFTLSRDMEGPDHKASLEPDELNRMVEGIRNIEKAIGTGIKKSTPSEQRNINIARKSIHLVRSLKAGDRISEDDLIMLRPGDGISPMMLDWVVGKRLNKDLEFGTKLMISDLQ